MCLSRPELIKKNIFGIAQYVPGKSIPQIAEDFGLDPDSVIKLGSNENPLGPSPKAVEAIIEHAGDVSVYPSADARELVEAISSYISMPTPNIVASGPGMDGLLDGLMRLLIESGDEVIIPTPTFSYYEIAARANGASPVFVERTPDHEVDMNGILDAITDRTKIIFLCSPNNPSGTMITTDDLRRILDASRGLVFVDEAYVEFADHNVAALVKDYDNLVVGRTFSKAFGLAGMRIGYGIVPEWLRSEYMRAATPFNVSGVAIAAGVAALSDTEHLGRSIELARTGREELKREIPFKVYDSQANFVLVDVAPLKAEDVSRKFMESGIIVRNCTSFRDAGDCLIRVTVGTPQQNRRVIEGFNDVA
ncbi:MAG: histidinol-phosphate transaminase [Euryarchaeota archaeon]|nr:histidinol-phosphate transaminase [Euryarchaeota archaeon]